MKIEVMPVKGWSQESDMLPDIFMWNIYNIAVRGVTALFSYHVKAAVNGLRYSLLQTVLPGCSIVWVLMNNWIFILAKTVIKTV